MNNEIVGFIVLMAIILTLLIGIVWGIWSYGHHQQKLLEYYDNIQIGDKYFFTVGPLHPFDTDKRKHTTEIINKTLAGGKHPWVQYRYDDGSVNQCELHEFLTEHKKVNK